MRPLARLRAALLVLLFVGMGVVAPFLDGVLLHRNADPSRPHVEMRDNPACHGERCAISLFQATSRSGPAAVARPLASVPVTTGLTLLPSASPRTADRPDQLRSRAPPSPLA